MNAIPDLIPLHDNRPGLRSLLEVQVRETEGPAEPATLDFVASTATLDRYHEIIEPAGWRPLRSIGSSCSTTVSIRFS